MSEIEPMSASMWVSLLSWFTPTVLFCFLNLMIGTIFIASKLKSPTKRHLVSTAAAEGDNYSQLFRPPSLLQRLGSINFSVYRPEQTGSDPFTTEPRQRPNPRDDPTSQKVEETTTEEDHSLEKPELELQHHVTRSKSDTCSTDTQRRTPARKMMKSASEKTLARGCSVRIEVEEEVDRRRPATVRETTSTGEVDEAVDAKADDFINRFRQQLKLQRLDSILRYKEMLNRGSAR